MGELFVARRRGGYVYGLYAPDHSKLRRIDPVLWTCLWTCQFGRGDMKSTTTPKRMQLEDDMRHARERSRS